MLSHLRFFKSSFIITLLGLAAAYALGGPKAMFIAAILSVLEVSLSFDNAVVNATVLKDMDAVWRRRFMTWGMLIAVFGMRVIFPVLIVAVIAQLSPWAALTLAIQQPEQYATTLTSSHIIVAGFGGAFLMLVFLKFFFDQNKEVHWLPILESPLVKMGKMGGVEIGICLAIVYFISTQLALHNQLDFILAAITGIIIYIIVDGFGALLGSEENHSQTVVVRTGFSAFMYLEVLDASFSFDGVIGAFALSNNIFIIAIGLGIGAMFVRSLTIMFVEKGTLDQFRYLEHGAFYAIGALAFIMFIGTFHEIHEVITGLIGAIFIIVSLIASLRYKKNHSS
ncbi:DUF475 domain-containing protein [Iodobacter fluviatilis]|uniref:Integral membrane protein, YkoY family n=1 Tax=Iodobacter fluviatilis TaxID=537 RepID=A0A7G3G890_9NEIS|nr:DUF475 domain-containing protein [Iodobacter fluviatilis]QBC43035.1 hypothetical protein C1H71_05370 [Iodobacter fluviatilis]